MRRLLALSLLVLVSACDGGDDGLALDAAFYTGTWRLTTVRDASGDRTALVQAAVSSLTAAFNADGTFRIDVDFTPLVNSTGQADRVVTGTYQAFDESDQLVLVSSGLAPAFGAAATTRSTVTLTAGSAIVGALLGSLPLTFTGDVTLTLARQ